MFKSILEYFTAALNWFIQGIPVDRLNGDSTGRKWFIQQVGYTKDLLTVNLRTITDTADINSEIKKRIPIKDANTKQGIQALKVQLSSLYSFKKCFVARHKTRLQYYRDDLSQKGYRNMLAVQQSYNAFASLDKSVSTQNT